MPRATDPTPSRKRRKPKPKPYTPPPSRSDAAQRPGARPVAPAPRPQNTGRAKPAPAANRRPVQTAQGEASRPANRTARAKGFKKTPEYRKAVKAGYDALTTEQKHKLLEASKGTREGRILARLHAARERNAAASGRHDMPYTDAERIGVELFKHGAAETPNHRGVVATGDTTYADALEAGKRAGAREFVKQHGKAAVTVHERDPYKLEAAGFAPPGFADKLAALPISAAVNAVRGAAATGVAAYHDPIGVPEKTLSQAGKAALALPGGLVDAALHPAKAVDESVTDIDQRAHETFGERVARIRKEGGLADITDALIAIPALSAGAKPIASHLLRISGRELPQRALRITSGGADELVREGGLIRLATGAAKDRAVARSMERQVRRADAGEGRVDPLVRRAVEMNREAGRPVAVVKGTKLRNAALRKTVSKQRARGVFGLKHDLRLVGGRAQKALARLNKNEKRAFYYSAVYGIHDAAQGVEILTPLRDSIREARAQAGGWEPRGAEKRADMLPDLDRILEAPELHFTERLDRTVNDLAPDSLKVADEDPRLAERQAQLRRQAPLADVLGLERGVTSEIVPDRRKNRMEVQQVDPLTFRAAYDQARAGDRGHALTDYTDAERSEMTLLLNADKTAGAAIKPDGDIVNVFRLPGAPKGAGAAMVREALKRGGYKLDATGSGLRKFYEGLGFKTYRTEKWDPAYGEPPTPGDSDISYMRHAGQPLELTRTSSKPIGLPNTRPTARENALLNKDTPHTPEEQAELDAFFERVRAAKPLFNVDTYDLLPAREKVERRAPGQDMAEAVARVATGDIPDMRELRFLPDESADDFAARVASAIEAKGLREPLYFRSERYADDPAFGNYTVGGLNRTREDQLYRGDNLRIGLQDTGISTYLNGLAKNIKAKWNARLVDELLEEHTLAKYNDTGARSLREIRDALARDGINPQAVAFWNPGIYAERLRALKDDDLGVDLIEAADAPENLSALRAATDTVGAADTAGWKVLPAAVMRELEHEMTPSGPAGRAYDIAKGWASKMILLTGNVPWLGAQVVQNALGGLAATGGRIALPHNWAGAWKRWHSLSDDERAEIGGFLGLDATAADIAPRRMGGAGGTVTQSWRALHDWGGWHRGLARGRGPSIADFNPVQAMARLDRTQNNAARVLVWHTLQKKAEYKGVVESSGRLYATQQAIMRRLEKPDGERLLLTDKKLLEKHADQVIKFLGDFASLTAFERKFLGRAIMFYPFVRFSVRLATYTLPIEHPLVTGIVMEIARQEAEDREAMFGAGSLRYTGGKVYLGDGKAVDLTKLNPLGNAIFGSLSENRPAALLGILPPYAGMLFNQASDSDYFSGAKQFYQGDPSKAYAQGVSQLPLVNGTRARIAAQDVLGLSAAYRLLRDNEINPAEGFRHDPDLEGYQGADSLIFAPAPVEFGAKDPSDVQKAKAAAAKRNELTRESNDGIIRALIPFLPENENDAVRARDQIHIQELEDKPPEKRRRARKTFGSGGGSGLFGAGG